MNHAGTLTRTHKGTIKGTLEEEKSLEEPLQETPKEETEPRNPKTLDITPLNPEPLNPKPRNPKPLNPTPLTLKPERPPPPARGRVRKMPRGASLNEVLERAAQGFVEGRSGHGFLRFRV